VREMCATEEAFGDTNSCEAMERVSRKDDAQRASLKRMLAALECEA